MPSFLYSFHGKRISVDKMKRKNEKNDIISWGGFITYEYVVIYIWFWPLQTSQSQKKVGNYGQCLGRKLGSYYY